jgi:hypothetical protein
MVNLREELGPVSPAWQGTRLPNVHTVYLTPESETDAYGGRAPPSEVPTPGGVYLWRNGYVTCYTDEEGKESEGVIYPTDAIARLEFGPHE